MTRRTCIYVIQHGVHSEPYVQYSIEKIRAVVDRLIVVVQPGMLNETDAELDKFNVDKILSLGKSGVKNVLAGYKIGLEEVRKSRNEGGAILLTGSQSFGPVSEISDDVFSSPKSDAHIYAPYWHDAKLEARLSNISGYGKLVTTDFVCFSSAVTQGEAFWKFWDDLPLIENYWEQFTAWGFTLSDFIDANKIKLDFPEGSEVFKTSDPGKFEVHKVVKLELPCVAVSSLMMPVISHDLNATYFRDALDDLREINPRLYSGIIALGSNRLPLREFNSAADQYEILSDTYNEPDQNSWEFGRFAVFIHVFYADMMDQFWEQLEKLPKQYDLYVSTSTQENNEFIQEYLNDKGMSKVHFTVRNVEFNRGRDMASLFITFRDIIITGQYEVALRLHSKRTPQVSRQVGESFKDHLFGNLVASKPYVKNVLDLLEAQKDIGLLIPPVIHIGFGTLGHAWFNNKYPLMKLCKTMGIDVPLDHHTPVAPYGTMYWFRTDALRRMFEWKWKWEDYNEEPNHTDGGVAHIQERLIGYCVQERGYRVVSIMSPKLAARYYAKLEYKMQLLASGMANKSIFHQVTEMENYSTTWLSRLNKYALELYGSIIRKSPRAKKMLSPLVRQIKRSRTKKAG